MALPGLNLQNFLSSLTTNPDVMVSKASTVQVKIREMQAAFQELERTVNKTHQYWIGEAGDAHREFYNEQRDNIQEIFLRLSEDVTDLKEMAMVYSATEHEVKELSLDLPSDVIV